MAFNTSSKLVDGGANLTISGADSSLTTNTTFTASAAAAGATITINSGKPTANQTIVLISTDGTSKTYTAVSGNANAASNQFSIDNNHDDVALSLELAIEHSSGHNGKILVSRSSNVLSLTQSTTGTAGNTAITNNLSNTDAPDNFVGGSNGTLVAASLDISGDADIDGTTNLDDTDIDGTLVVDGSNISLDSTSTLNIDNSNTSNGITIGTATSGVPISIGHTTSEVTVNDNLTVTGDLTVNGALTTLQSTNTIIKDTLIELANGASTGADSGIIIERGSTGDNAAFIWDESRDEFVLGTTTATGASTGDLTVTRGNLSVERIGAGTEQAQAKVHAINDGAASPSLSTNAVVIIEDDNRPALQLVGSANNIALIQFGDNAAASSGQIYYDHSTDKLRIDAGGNSDRITVDANGDLTVANDIKLTSDSAVLSFGASSDVTISHVANTGLLLNSTNVIQFNDASQNIGAPNATTLDINATDEIELNATLIDVNGNLDVSGTYTGGGLMTTGGNIVIPDAGSIGSASDTNAITISSGGVVAVTATTASSAANNGALTVAGGAGIAADLSVGDDLRLTSDDAVLSMGADNDVTLTHDGTTGVTIAANPITLDSGADIVLDADGADVILKDGGTEFGRFTNSSTDFVIKSATNDKDIIFKGVDNSQEITALTLDMSEAGAAAFNGTVTANAGVIIDNITIDGTEIDLSSGDLTLDVAGDIILNADGGDIQFSDGSDDILKISNSSSDVVLQPLTDAKDIKLNQYDGRTILEINDAGYVAIGNGATGSGEIRIYEDTDNGTNYSGFKVGTQSGDIDYVLPTADGSDGHFLKTNGSGVLSWAAASGGGGSTAADDITNGDAAVNIVTTSGNITLDAQANDADIIFKVDDNGQAVTALTLDGSDEGNAVFVNDLKLSSDSAAIHFGADNEITLTHVADTGLTLKHTATADDKPVTLTLATGETDMAANDVIAKIAFQAPDEGTGTDAVLVAAAIQAVSEGDFAADANATRLEFMTAASEAAAAKMTLSSAGVLDVDGGITVDNITIDGTEIDLSSGDLTLDVAGDIVLDADGADVILKDGGTEFGRFTNSSTDFIIKSATNDKDMIFKGVDNSQEITALTLDMSDAGRAVFNNDVRVGVDLEVLGALFVGAGANEFSITESSDDITLKSLISDKDLKISGNDGGSNVDALSFDMSDAGRATFNNDVRVGVDLEVLGALIVGAGADEFSITESSDDVTLKSLISDKDLKISGNDGGANVDALSFDMSEAGAATFNSTVTANAGVIVDNITIDGTEIDLSSGDLTIDVAGDIILDADGADVILKDAGTEYGRFSRVSSDLVIKSMSNDNDMLLKGIDGGVTITALTLDMSDAGRATFNNDVRVGVDCEVLGDLIVGANADEFSISEGSDDITISTLVQDKDMIFKVNDGGSATEVFRLDGDVSALKIASGKELQFADSGEKISSDGTDLTIASGGKVVIDSVAGIDIDSAAGDVTFMDAGTAQLALDLDGTAGEIIMQLKVDSDDFVFKQYDGTEVIRFTDGADVEVKDNMSLKSDASVVKFGANEEITLTHVHDTGLTITNTINGTDNRPCVLQLKSEEDAIVLDDVIASIEFAAGDSDGTDGATVAAGIHAIAEGTFSASANATSLVFTTGASETAASSAAAKMKLSSVGDLTLFGDTHTFQSENANDPQLLIKNTANDASGGAIIFDNNRGGNNGAQNDVCGKIEFAGQDASGNPQTYAIVSTTIETATHGSEGGSFTVEVANDNGNLSTGLKIVESSATGVLNVELAAGTASQTHTAGRLGVGNSAPKTALDVVHDYHNVTFENQLASAGDGGGHVIKYNRGSNPTLTLGQLHYLNTSGVWTQTDADGVANGGTQLLGIAMGTNPQSNGILLHGFVRVPQAEILNVPTNVDGLPVYVSTTAGHIDFNAPAGAGDFVRIVGHAVDKDSNDVLIWFCPSPNHVEL